MIIMITIIVTVRSATMDGNIVSRTMHWMVAYVDHWFTNLCVWMLVRANLYHPLALGTVEIH